MAWPGNGEQYTMTKKNYNRIVIIIAITTSVLVFFPSLNKYISLLFTLILFVCMVLAILYLLGFRKK